MSVDWLYSLWAGRPKFGWVTLQNENYETQVKEIEVDIEKWKDILCSWIRRRILLKGPYYSYQNIHDIFSQNWNK